MIRTDSPGTDGQIESRYLLAQSVAMAAGTLALEMFRRRDQLVVELKGVQDMVSAADRDVENYVRERILRSFPDDGFLGEEGGERSASTLEHCEYVWVVDPIDGTACFVNGMYSWCVSIAVLYRGTPLVGVVFDPNANELFHARVGRGAFCGAKPMRVHAGRTLKDGVLGVGTSFRVGIDDFIPFLAAVLGDGGMFIRNGSGALMITYVAAGRLIGYYEPHMNSWDALAGLVLVNEAGGRCNAFMDDDGLHRGNPVLASNAEVWYRLAQHAGLLASQDAAAEAV